MFVDAHQHFWQYSASEYAWIGEQESVLQRDFLPQDLSPILADHSIDGCVAVQARQSEQETRWLLELAEQHAIIKGVVGWVDLRDDNLAAKLASYGNNPWLKGFRHVLQDEPDPNFMLDTKFVRGLGVLADNNYCYDILVYASQLPQTLALVVKQLTNLPLVIDHIAKPQIATNSATDSWKEHIYQLASYSNVFCKVSGMVTEADHQHWEQAQFTQYLDVVFDAFGPDRIMFGSDWPVCMLAADYAQVKKIVADYVNQQYPDYFEQVFGLNACQFYQLK